MSFSARCLPAVLVAIISLPVVLCAQSTKQAIKAPRGTVSGRVTIKDKGVPGVAVGLRKSDFNNPYESFLRATTDPDGFYRITNVPAGAYEIAPSAPAYIIADSNNSQDKTVVVGEDENVEGINFSLVRGGVVTGKVIDAEGRPVIQQQVNLFSVESFNQQTPQRPVYASRNAITDDRGIYRMYGLRPGRYKVATGRGENTFSGNFGRSRTSYKQVFHPDVTEEPKATVIEVSEGSEAANVDIKLGAAMETFSVSGRVIDGEKGLPVPNARFGLQRLAGERTEFVGTSVVSDAQGEFLIDNLIPGKYTIFMFQNVSTELRADSFSFDVIDQDVTGVVVKLVKGASLAGVVVLESEDKAVLQKLQQLQLRAYVMVQGVSSYSQGSTSPIAADGTFRLPGLSAGTANLVLNSTMGGMPPKGFAISRIERDGVVTPRVEVKEGEQIAGLRVFVTFGSATIRGVVKFENGELPPGAQLYVRLMKPNQPGPGFGFRPPPVDSRGHFLMEGIPGGDYELIVQVPSIAGSRPRTVKRDVSVQDGVVTDVTITIDLSSPQNPQE